MQANLTANLIADKARTSSSGRREMFVDVPNDDGTFARYAIGTVDLTTDSQDGAWHVILTCHGNAYNVTAGLR